MSQLDDCGVGADWPACVQTLHAIDGWSFCPWYEPPVQSAQAVVLEENSFPEEQNLHDGFASVFWSWYLPVSHGVQVNVSVMVPMKQLRVPDPW